ncbi:MAG: ketoisovalerate oxidoreductase [Deltaproteobacteria bacterium]|nr:MAG: ketoisovalerate oxidoreductase [Deltaproteobacteria bacterium]
MYEIRFHGRGGQGTVLASKILAKAIVEEGKFAKAIPSFGFERRGAPVAAYLRSDDKIIRQATNIYHPHCIVCLDPTLMRTVNIFEGLRNGGVWVQATKKSIDDMGPPTEVSRVGLCDAFGIALKVFKKPITNSIMLGAFVKTTGLVSMNSLFNAMESVAFRDADLKRNLEAAEQGYEECKVYDLDRKEPL